MHLDDVIVLRCLVSSFHVISRSHGSEYEETIAVRPSHDGNIKAYLESNIHIEPAFIYVN
jgi:hypothetical protein